MTEQELIAELRGRALEDQGIEEFLTDYDAGLVGPDECLAGPPWEDDDDCEENGECEGETYVYQDDDGVEITAEFTTEQYENVITGFGSMVMVEPGFMAMLDEDGNWTEV